MNRLVTHISKGLALVAILLLPAQQSVAAGCCCHGGRRHVQQTPGAVPRTCCSPSGRRCCCRGNILDSSCFSKAAPNSASKPCQCPGTHCDKSPQDVMDPVAVETASGRVLTLASAWTGPLGAHEIATSDTRPDTLPAPARGTDRSILLCRWRL